MIIKIKNQAQLAVERAELLKSKIKINNGFTLIELIVAMGIFIVLMSIAVGGFINSLRNQRLVMALTTVNDNMSILIERMSREVRTGYDFSKISDNEFQFVNAKNQVIRYKLNNNAIERETVVSGRTHNNKITADNVKVVSFNIEICGKNLDPGIILNSCGSEGISSFPPRITLSFSITSAEPDIEKLEIFNNIQTTISSRVIQ